MVKRSELCNGECTPELNGKEYKLKRKKIGKKEEQTCEFVS
jgi:hypothetical protein